MECRIQKKAAIIATGGQLTLREFRLDQILKNLAKPALVIYGLTRR